MSHPKTFFAPFAALRLCFSLCVSYIEISHRYTVMSSTKTSGESDTRLTASTVSQRLFPIGCGQATLNRIQ